MKARIIALGAVALLLSCAEPNSPVYPPVKYALYEVSRVMPPGWAEDVAVHGDTAFVAQNQRGVAIYDVSHLEQPVLKEGLPVTVGNVVGVNYLAEYGLLFVNEARVDVYDAYTKLLVGSYWTGNPSDLYARAMPGGDMLVAEIDPNDGFRFQRLAWDAEFAQWDSVVSAGVAWPYPKWAIFRGLDVDEDTAYIAHGETGLDVYEMIYSGGTDTALFLGNTDTPGGAFDVALTRDHHHVAIADMQGGLVMADVTDRTHPFVVGQLLPPKVNGVFRVFARGDTAYFLDQFNGLFAADVSNPANPRLIANFDTTNPKGVFVTEDQTVYLADQDEGLIILRWR